ncbi:MAG: hypothetical protein R2831_00585 [Chitinophagaceae bacterium]
MYKLVSFILVFTVIKSVAQQTPYEIHQYNYTATYSECISFYENLAKQYETVQCMPYGMTDAGKPLHLVLISSDKEFEPEIWQQKNKVIFLINNGIHPGEPDGIDASMLWVRDIAEKKIILPPNIVIALIPIYNIGGMLQRGKIFV